MIFQPCTAMVCNCLTAGLLLGLFDCCIILVHSKGFGLFDFWVIIGIV
jgi:hypothetical protein